LKYQNLSSVPNCSYLFQWQPKVVVTSHLYSCIFFYIIEFTSALNMHDIFAVRHDKKKTKTINSQLINCKI